VGVAGQRAVEAFHGSTLHGEPPAEAGQLMRFQRLDQANQPAPFKTYPGAATRPLPRELRRSSLPAVDVLSGRRAEAQSLDDDLLGTLLFLTAGVTRVTYSGNKPMWFRPSMSAGNLHPIELYVVREGQVQHYHPLEHALVPLRSGLDLGAGAALVVTGIPFRTCWKYGERGWRHLWWDAGSMLANLLTVADAHGVSARIDTAFPDAALAALVGVDGVDEIPLALVLFGDGELRLPAPYQLGHIRARADPVARHVLRFPLVTEAQEATALRDAGAAAEWQQAASAATRHAPAVVDKPAVGHHLDSDRIEDVILRRGSTRFFRRQSADSELLRWALPAACRAVPWDIAAEGTLLEHLVNVHDVTGLASGRHGYADSGWREQRDRGDAIRQASTDLCVYQPLGGDSAYTVFHAAELEPLLQQLGGRGYRAAHLEAGIVSGRLALASVVLGFGATGLTFYDRKVSRFFDTDAAPLLATAVGVPATSPAPSGTPGTPAVLGGYGQAMTRLAGDLRRSTQNGLRDTAWGEPAT
jgi:SagB-type dehydrogenase family enzyme